MLEWAHIQTAGWIDIILCNPNSRDAHEFKEQMFKAAQPWSQQFNVRGKPLDIKSGKEEHLFARNRPQSLVVTVSQGR